MATTRRRSPRAAKGTSEPPPEATQATLLDTSNGAVADGVSLPAEGLGEASGAPAPPTEAAAPPVEATVAVPDGEPAGAERAGDNGGATPGPAAPAVAAEDAPKPLRISDLKEMGVQNLTQVAKGLNVTNATGMRKQELIFEILRAQAEQSGFIFSEGVLEVLPDGFGFLRAPDYNYLPGPTTSTCRRRRSGASTCTRATRCPARSGRRRKANATSRSSRSKRSTSNRRPGAREGIFFENLTPLYPERLRLEHDPRNLSTRVMDLMTPIGKGQRGLIVAPPRTGKTMLLQNIAKRSRPTTRGLRSSCCSSTSGPKK
jgi:hypothetical protein